MWESKASYIQLEVFGKVLGPKYKASYLYTLYLWRSEEDMIKGRARPGRAAMRTICKYVRTPWEEPQPRKERPDDYRFNDIFKPGCEYKGWWAHIDINSAEPYLVTKYLPELNKPIRRMYSKRKKHPKIKLTMNAINGNLRHTHNSIYHNVCKDLYNWLDEVWVKCENLGYFPIYTRRDAIILSIPKEDSPLPVKVGTKIGEWKAKVEYGTIRPLGKMNFDTDMEMITSKNSGESKPSYLDRVTIVCNKLLNKGVIIYEERNLERIEN